MWAKQQIEEWKKINNNNVCMNVWNVMASYRIVGYTYITYTWFGLIHSNKHAFVTHLCCSSTNPKVLFLAMKKKCENAAATISCAMLVSILKYSYRTYMYHHFDGCLFTCTAHSTHVFVYLFHLRFMDWTSGFSRWIHLVFLLIGRSD